jgi:sugar phosphate isomerase/epimerase
MSGTSGPLNRRRFLQCSFLGSAAVAVANLPGEAFAESATKEPRDPWHGLKIGLTSYTLRKFKLDQVITMTREAGVKYISLKDMHLPMKSTREERQEVRKKIEDAGLVLMGGGVIYMKNNEEEVRNDFEYARDAGMATIVCSPVPEAMDLVEKLVKEYDQRIAIHNHGPTDKNGFPSPLDVLKAVAHRDARMGICMDVGHTARIGQAPAPVIKKCATRLYEFHMKDVTAATPKGDSIEVGKGVIDIVGVLKALLKIKFSSHVALEYEANGDAPMPGVFGSFAFMRGVLAAI